MFVLSKKRRKKKIFDQLNPTSVCVCVFVVHTQKNNKKFEISLASRIKFEEREKDFSKKKERRRILHHHFLRARAVFCSGREKSRWS